jgi:hypothetical protein
MTILMMLLTVAAVLAVAYTLRLMMIGDRPREIPGSRFQDPQFRPGSFGVRLP